MSKTKKTVKKPTKKQIKKIVQKGGAVLGKGGFGCTIDPAVVCPNSQIKSKNIVSKLMVVKSNDGEAIDNIIGEYLIGKKLVDNDPKHIYFLGGLSVCELSIKRIEADRKLLKDVEDCDFKKYIKLNTHSFFNMVMPRGYEFMDVFKYLIDNKNLFRLLGHLVKGVRIAARKSNVTLLDIKYDNLLFTRYSENFICPVFIDFTSEHVLTKERTLYDYMRDFSSSNSDYYPWPPELKMLLYGGSIIKHNNRTPYNQKPYNLGDIIQTVLDYEHSYYQKIEKKGLVDIKKSFYYNLYHYYYGIRQMGTNDLLKKFAKEDIYVLSETTDFKQLYMDMVESLEVLNENLDRPLKKEVSEKLMLCQVGRMFQTLMAPYFSRFSLKPMNPNSPSSSSEKTIRLFHNIIYKMMHPNINKRPSADDILKRVSTLLNSKTISFETFLIDVNILNTEIKDKVKKSVGMKTKKPDHLKKYLKTPSKDISKKYKKYTSV